jgi:hypothetical protein
VRVPLPQGEHMKLQHNQSILAIFFKEVLQDTPEADAEKLVEAYRGRKSLTVEFTESPRGEYVHVAFRWSIKDRDDIEVGLLNQLLEK